MNDRTVGYYPSESCDTCWEKGAYDFMGDLICDRCIREAESSAVEGQPQPYDNESLRTELATLRSEHGRLRSIAKSAASCHVALEEDNETLRAENERLTNYLKGTLPLTEENEHLRAALRTETADHSRTQQLLANRVGKENAALRAAQDARSQDDGKLERAIEALRAENTQIREQLPGWIEREDALSAEVERLRAALTLVRDTQGGRYGWPWDHVEAHVNAALGLVRPIPSAGGCAMNDVTRLLEAARARITDPAHWTQGVLARDANGINCAFLSSGDPVCWCALGSLNMSAETLHANQRTYQSANCEMVAAAQRMHERTISTVNDKCGHEATLRMFDDAIKHSKMGEA